MKSDATLACTMCQHCGQPSNWTHDDGSCPRCGKQRTPPIAQPPAAAHVERRAGQRWKCAWGGDVVEATVVGEKTDLGTWPMSNGDYWCESRWTGKGAIGSICTMTLLADAPPEPAKSTTPQCESFCRPGLRCKYCTTEAVGPSPPAQEAPKAAPVLRCKWEHATTPCAGPFAIRHVGMADKLEPRIWCEGHMLEYERQAASRPATGTPYAGPTRLPRPQLAADWVEDCLPTVWR